ncbi:MAG: flavin reductase family protein [Chloroflexi bacterium]|nr:flavin reductase family protein [Chloroflexota bacterium]
MSSSTVPFNPRFFPQHVLLLTIGDNMMPMGYWTVISKDPFRFLICMGVGNHSLTLLKKYREAALHFMPWGDRQKVVRAGYISGRNYDKAEELGFALRPAEKLQHTRLIEGADIIYETVVHQELPKLSTEFALYVMDVVATQGKKHPTQRQPLFYLCGDDFAGIGEKWRYQR